MSGGIYQKVIIIRGYKLIKKEQFATQYHILWATFGDKVNFQFLNTSCSFLIHKTQ